MEDKNPDREKEIRDRKDALLTEAEIKIAAIRRDARNKIKDLKDLLEKRILELHQERPDANPNDQYLVMKITRATIEFGDKAKEINTTSDKLIADINRDLQFKLAKIGSHSEDAERLNQEGADSEIAKELNEIGKRHGGGLH
jgi:hypothetical protein